MPEAERLACSLVEWDGTPGRCRLCNAPLEGRRTSWCSDECSYRFDASHIFSWGRHLVIVRDGWTCVRCGRSPWHLGAWIPIARAPNPRWYTPPLFDRFRFPVSTDELRAHGAAVHALALEVNHITPVRGVRSMGCWNHLDNLETLCHECHVAETRLQITTPRAYGGSRTIACWEGLHDHCWARDTDGLRACVDGCHPWSEDYVAGPGRDGRRSTDQLTLEVSA